MQAGLYASFTQGPLYVDGLAGWAYNANQMWRAINILGLLDYGPGADVRST